MSDEPRTPRTQPGDVPIRSGGWAGYRPDNTLEDLEAEDRHLQEVTNALLTAPSYQEFDRVALSCHPDFLARVQEEMRRRQEFLEGELRRARQRRRDLEP